MRGRRSEPQVRVRSLGELEAHRGSGAGNQTGFTLARSRCAAPAPPIVSGGSGATPAARGTGLYPIARWYAAGGTPKTRLEGG